MQVRRLPETRLSQSSILPTGRPDPQGGKAGPPTRNGSAPPSWRATKCRAAATGRDAALHPRAQDDKDRSWPVTARMPAGSDKMWPKILEATGYYIAGASKAFASPQAGEAGSLRTRSFETHTLPLWWRLMTSAFEISSKRGRKAYRSPIARCALDQIGLRERFHGERSPHDSSPSWPMRSAPAASFRLLRLGPSRLGATRCDHSFVRHSHHRSRCFWRGRCGPRGRRPPLIGIRCRLCGRDRGGAWGLMVAARSSGAAGTVSVALDHGITPGMPQRHWPASSWGTPSAVLDRLIAPFIDGWVLLQFLGHHYEGGSVRRCSSTISSRASSG